MCGIQSGTLIKLAAAMVTRVEANSFSVSGGLTLLGHDTDTQSLGVTNGSDGHGRMESTPQSQRGQTKPCDTHTHTHT